MALVVESAVESGHVVVAVRGEVDIATAGLLRDHLRAALTAGLAVVVDLGDVPFMDSTGLGVLVDASKRAHAAGTALVLARPQRIVRNALRLVRVDVLIDVYDTLDAALATAP
jgi:anti-sigma B factor antagonist